MKISRTAYTAAVALFALSAPAIAGGVAPTPAEPAQMAPAPVAAAHDWSGWYADAYAGAWMAMPGDNFLGLNAGYNMTDGAMIYGGELGYFIDPSAGFSNISIAGRLGTALGDDAMAFGRIGLSQDMPITNTYFLLGLGGQYALSEDLYLRGEFDWEFPTGGGAADPSLRLGIGLEF